MKPYREGSKVKRVAPDSFFEMTLRNADGSVKLDMFEQPCVVRYWEIETRGY